MGLAKVIISLFPHTFANKFISLLLHIPAKVFDSF